MTAIVSLSGGQDSTTCLVAALQRHKRVHCVSMNYQQRHGAELEAAQRVVEYLTMRYPAATLTHQILDIPKGLFGDASPLTSDKELETYESKDVMDKVIGNRRELTFVPGRNLVFSSLLVPIAAQYGAQEIYVGICSNDHANYPDCTVAFYEAMRKAINEAVGDESITLMAPLLHLEKHKALRWLSTMRGGYAALQYTHTAYSGEFPPVTQDHATVLRASAFAELGWPDPLLVRAYVEGLLNERPPFMHESDRDLSDVIERINNDAGSEVIKA